MKKWIRAALACVLILSFITACSNSGGNGKDGSETPPPAVSQEADTNEKDSEGKQTPQGSMPSYYSAEPATITMFIGHQPAWPYQENWPVWKWIKEDTNITVKGVPAMGDSNDTLALNIASGNMQDIVTLYMREAMNYGSQGAFVDMSTKLDAMPNVKRYLEAHPDIRARATTPDGAIYYIPNDGAGITNSTVWFYREDVFHDQGIAPPTTWEELYAALKILKEKYPDSYPFTIRHGLGTLAMLAPSFGIHATMYPDPETGKVKYGPVDDNFKELLGWLHKFYSEGLMPPDFLSFDYNRWLEFMNNDKAFVTMQYIGQIEIVNNQLKKGKLKFLPPPAGTGGKAYLPNNDFEISGLAVATDSKNVDAALKYIDYLFSEQGIERLSWGKEGETYTVISGKRSFPDKFKQFTDLRKDVGILTLGTYGQFNPESLISIVAEDEQYAYEEVRKYLYPRAIIDPTFTAEELEQNLQSPVHKYAEENMSKFILGQRPLSEWDQYVKELEDRGLQALIDLYQRGYDR
ncbi:extracellular solute-binding protein [Paenibacillus sp. GCM10027626]|uniref:extracellular solute-binding protein n=1 Tax=Paenibacillus sp. GCM10027626 TaxID=3273411 RepID=UPI0036261B0E